MSLSGLHGGVKSTVKEERERYVTFVHTKQKCKDLLNCSACFNTVGVVSVVWVIKVLPSVGCK